MPRAAFIEPCFPVPSLQVPDRLQRDLRGQARRLPSHIPSGFGLITRRGNDWTTRFPLVVEAVNLLKLRSCLIDGEVVCCDERHFIRCPACGGWIDCRDLGQVFEHEGPLPHSAQDQPQ